MKSFTPTSNFRNSRAFLASVLTCLMLVAPITPVGFAATTQTIQAKSNAAAKRQADRKETAPAPQGVRAQKSQPVTPNLAPGDIVATKSDTILNDALGDGKAQAGDTIKYDITITNNGTTDALNVQLDDTISQYTSLVGDSIHATPLARNDAYTTVGNTLLEVGVPAGAAPAVRVAGSSFANDANPTDPSSFVSATQPTNGTVTFNADGTFTYLPNVGFTGTDTFTYTVRNNADSTLTDTATITITVSDRVWYVNNAAAAGGDGRSTSPFQTLAPVNGAGGAGDSDAANDFIYLFQGASPYTTGITLETGQQLIGNGVDLVVSTFNLRTGSPAQRPTISNGTGNIITLASNNTVRGLNTGDASGIDITGTSFGTFTASDIAIGGTGRPLSLTTGTLNATFDSITSTNSSGGQGILIQTNVAGTMTVTNGTTITGSTTQGILVSGSTATINFGNTSVAGGTDGISLSNNSAGTRTFGTLTRTGGSGIGFLHAVGGGITNITGTTSITGTGGRGIDIEDSTTAVTFANVSVGTNGGTGVFLEDNSGAITFADFDVTPNANQKAVTINNSTGAVTATSGDLSATGNSVLEITGPAGRTPLAMSLTSLASTNNANAGGLGLDINFTSGAFTVTGATNIQNPAGIGIRIQNSTTTFNFQGNTTSNLSGGTAIFLNANSGNITFPASGTFQISPDSGQRGLHATANTGTITASLGTVSTTNGTGVEIVGPSAASKTPLNIQFTSVNVAGTTAPNGIVLGNTSAVNSPGGFRVNGNGGTCTFATPTCTGGRITTTSGGDAGATPAATTAYPGIGVRLHDAAGVVLTRMRIDNHPNFAIRGITVNGFTLDASVIDGTNGSNTGADVEAVANGEDAVRFTNLTGVAAISNSFIGGGHENIVRVINDTGTLNRLTISNSTIGDLDGGGAGFGNSVAGGDDAIIVSSTGTAVLNVTLSNLILNQAKGDVVQIAANQASTMDLIMRGNSISNNHTAIVSGVGGVTIGATSGAGQTSTLTYDVSCNKFRDSKGNGVTFFKGVGGTSNMTGTVFNNRVGVTGVAASGAASGANGLQFDANGVGTHTVLVKNNIIFRYGSAGIGMNANDGSSTLNATVIGNTTNEPDSVAFAGFFAEVGAIPASDTNRINLKLGGAGAEQNNFVNGDPFNGSDVLYSKIGAGTQFNLSRAASAANDAVTITQNNNVTPITVVAPAGMTFVNTVPALPAAINESCSPPAAAAPLNPVLVGNDVPESPAVVATSAATVAAQPAATNNVTGQPFVSLPQAASALPQAGTNSGQAKQDAAQASKTADDNGGGNVQPLQAAFPVIIPVLQPNESVTITFQVKVNLNIPNNVTSVSNRGRVTSSSFPGQEVLTENKEGNTITGGATETPILPRPTYTINNASVPEPSSGSTPMAFTVTLDHAYGSDVSVSFSTADGTATAADGDYTPTSGTLTFVAGQTVQTISVPVLANGDTSDENFTVTLSNPVDSVLGSTVTATGTITEANPPGRVLISELRTSGPGGAGDDFVELYNNQDVSQDISGWAIVKTGASCGATPVIVAVIPAATTIPARGHYLIVGPAYSLAATAPGNVTAVADIEADRNIGLFNTSNLLALSTTTREDAVGFDANVGGNNCDLIREGASLLSASDSASQYSFARTLITGLPKETNDNAADFLLVSTTPAVAVGSNLTPALGAPGPENLAAPIQRNAVIKSSLVDPTVAATAPPNRVRSGIIDPGGPNAFGTLSIQRKFTNTLGVPVTRLRFRVVDLTTINNRAPGSADLRVLSSTGVVRNSAGTVVRTVTGLTLEAPPQPNGGGLNSALTVVLPGGMLAPGNSIEVQFLLGVQEQGAFSFFVNVEALPGPSGAAGTILDGAATKGVTSGKQNATAPKEQQ